MCLAIYKPATVQVDWDALEEGFKSNSHGAGFAVVQDGKVQICKGFFKFDEFRDAFAPYELRQAAIHFRLATHGQRNGANCHPFAVTDDLALIHNGILNIKCDVDKDMSDTWHYVHHILTPLAERDRDFYSNPEIRFLGECAISSSKFVFLRADGDYCIWNEEDGHWKGDIWYSNRSYERLSIGFGPRKTFTNVGTANNKTTLLTKTDWRFDDERDDEPWCRYGAGNEPLSDLYDPDNSRVFDDLTDREQMLYEMLIEEGWDIDLLDDAIEKDGVNALYEMANEYKERD